LSVAVVAWVSRTSALHAALPSLSIVAESPGSSNYAPPL
jgi:hypothetical protein